MAPYCDDNEPVQTQARQQATPTEHDRLLGDQGQASLYRTLSVRFVPNGTLSGHHTRGRRGVIDLGGTIAEVLVLTTRSAVATLNISRKMTVTPKYQDENP